MFLTYVGSEITTGKHPVGAWEFRRETHKGPACIPFAKPVLSYSPGGQNQPCGDTGPPVVPRATPWGWTLTLHWPRAKTTLQKRAVSPTRWYKQHLCYDEFSVWTPKQTRTRDERYLTTFIRSSEVDSGWKWQGEQWRQIPAGTAGWWGEAEYRLGRQGE